MDRHHKKNIEEMKEIVRDYDGFIGMSREKFPREVLEQASRLCVITKYGIGVDHIDLEAASENGVLVSVSPVNRIPVAEHTITLMLALLKQLRYSQKFLNQDNWRCMEAADYELFGKVIGFVGLGGITREVIKRLNGWGFPIIKARTISGVSASPASGFSSPPGTLTRWWRTTPPPNAAAPRIITPPAG